MNEASPNRDPILPEAGKRNVLVTSALPYVNNVPHLGNLIGSVLSGDVFARYCRARGINTLYIGGTDEYGTTTEAKALSEKCTPQELCDKYHAIHAEIYKWFNISFDIFGQERMTTQLYCEEHHSFLADRFVEGNCPVCDYEDARGDQCDLCGQLLEPLQLKHPRCKIDGSAPITRVTKHIFLELDKLQPEIETFFRDSVEKAEWSSNGKQITSAWLKEGLQPRSITRDMKWGTKVPLPGYEEKVIYSWFDACIGYVSITAAYTDQWEKWWRNPDVQLHQFIGKDNVVFHSVIFPASQIGTGDTWTKLHHLSTTDYLTYEGGKFSKSRGIGVFGDPLERPACLLTYGATTYLRIDRKLNLGNFVNRVLKFVNSKNYNNIVPDWTEYHQSSFEIWKDEVNTLLAQYIQELDAVKLRAALSTVLQISHLGNAFLQSNKLDNSLAANEPSKCAAVIGLAVNLVHLLASVVAPYMPETAKGINSQLRLDPLPIIDYWNADSVKPGHEIGKAEYLFSNIKPEKAQEWRKAFGSDEAKKVKVEEVALKAKKSEAMKAASLAK
ncbi:methionyl-tRNA synthetase [Lophium mytilinum]|uniref:methionine--tRNA ligase n=1 Tax=Lophium mytilinum TaxID=390894 RepID=A0A6A6QZ83_9PEZI|nr:methionyl-tRNA synthetase [Lophium mytilinum]